MSLGATHYCYLFVGKRSCPLTLLNPQALPRIMESVEPLLSFTQAKKAKITAEQYGQQQKLKNGRLRWDQESLTRLCRNGEAYPPKEFFFQTLTAEFPSINVAYKRQETVDLYLYVENDLYWGKVHSQGDCGLLLSLREDIYNQAGAPLVNRVILQLRELFDQVRVLYHKRPWWSKGKGEESALQDVAAWRALDKLCAANYQNWVEL